jgi:pimeloyl-ACP methyl ester carboxylesterase
MTENTKASDPRLNHVICASPVGLHRMAYWEWGERANPRVLVCVHGLSRQGRDFDTLARDLSSHYRVICPDVVGRGRSAWLADPRLYGIPTYLADMVTLVARLDVAELHWVGTSMGGLIGMALAAQAGTPITRLVLNDVGPVIEPGFIPRVLTYLGVPAFWRTQEEAADALAAISRGFGPHSREEWLALSRHQLVAAEQEGPTGKVSGFKTHYDPAIAVPVRAATPETAAAGEALLWQLYDRIGCPTLLLRGAESDLLSPATAAAMASRGPRCEVHELPGVGHAPTLVAADQRAVVRRFLLGA